MSKIRGNGTKPEIFVRKFLFSHGIRYRKNVKKLPGTPDIVLSKYNTAIFIHGCFWHGHKNCKSSKLPSTNKSFWYNKISKNIIRDKKNKKDLKKLGWKVITIWQCKLKNNSIREKSLEALLNSELL